MRHHVKGWSNPFLSVDRKHLWVRAEIEGAPSIDLEIPFNLTAQLVEGVSLAGQQAAIEAGDEFNQKPDFSGDKQWDAIPVRGLALALGKDASETLLVVDLFRTRLAFALDNKQVRAVGASFARTAAMLSADPENPN